MWTSELKVRKGGRKIQAPLHRSHSIWTVPPSETLLSDVCVVVGKSVFDIAILPLGNRHLIRRELATIFHIDRQLVFRIHHPLIPAVIRDDTDRPVLTAMKRYHVFKDLFLVSDDILFPFSQIAGGLLSDGMVGVEVLHNFDKFDMHEVPNHPYCFIV